MIWVFGNIISAVFRHPRIFKDVPFLPLIYIQSCRLYSMNSIYTKSLALWNPAHFESHISLYEQSFGRQPSQGSLSGGPSWPATFRIDIVVYYIQGCVSLQDSGRIPMTQMEEGTQIKYKGRMVAQRSNV